MSGEVLLALRDVCFQYGDLHNPLPVLQGVDFSIASGERVALVGRSGSGKSTLMNVLAGLLLPTSGDVIWAGTAIAALSDSERVAMRRHTIGVVYQFHHLLPEFTARENIMLPSMLAGLSVAEARARADALLAQVSLESRGEHRPGELSGGERQRIAIARALSAKPKVLLMDEPTGNLDEATADQVLGMLLDLSATMATGLLVVTHDRRIAGHMDRCLELHHGTLRPVL